MEHRMLKWFDYEHLSGDYQEMSKKFRELAIFIIENSDGGAEQTVSLRKLLESKDAAVRAVVHPGG